MHLGFKCYVPLPSPPHTTHPTPHRSPSLAGLSERLGLKRCVPMAVERGVHEILAPVVERSVTIACYTAVELVVKDFAVDPDEGRMRRWGGQAGGCALVQVAVAPVVCQFGRAAMWQGCVPSSLCNSHHLRGTITHDISREHFPPP